MIGYGETSSELMERLALIGADLLLETLSKIGSLEPVKQNEDEATLAPILKKEDGLLSWMLSATEISQRVRGFQPFPTGFLFVAGKSSYILEVSSGGCSASNWPTRRDTISIWR